MHYCRYSDPFGKTQENSVHRVCERLHPENVHLGSGNSEIYKANVLMSENVLGAVRLSGWFGLFQLPYLPA